jgi:hypothetical protein
MGAVSHTCNPSYAGGRDQEDLGLRSVWAKSYRDFISIEKQGMVCSPLISTMREAGVGWRIVV